MYKYLLILAFVVSSLYSKDITFYSGHIDKDGSEGLYEGFLFKNQSEDETMTYKLGLKGVNFYGENYTQTETFISIDQELDLEKSLEFGMMNIDNDNYGGQVYMSILHIHSYKDYEAGLYFSNYVNVKAYQADFSMKSFVSATSSFYIQPKVFLVETSEKDFYKTLEFKLGYTHETRDISIAPLIGKNQYLMKDNYSCNLGLITKYGLKVDYVEQINERFLTKFEYTYHHLEKDENLNVICLSLSYKY